MRFRSTLLAAVILLSSLGATGVSVATADSSDGFVLQPGVIFYADTQSNWGYLLNPDGTYKPFPIGSGMQKTVHYLNQTYFAATPSDIWVVRERKIQPDRISFGDTGRFFRLFDDERTYYGIHSIADKKWTQKADRYLSFGCILVEEDVLDLVEKAYELNGKVLVVITQNGVERFIQELTARQQLLAQGL